MIPDYLAPHEPPAKAFPFGLAILLAPYAYVGGFLLGRALMRGLGF